MDRSRSLPPIGNPFWSDKAQGEFQLQVNRPSELPPVPPVDERELEEGSPMPVQDLGNRRSRTPNRGKGRGSEGVRSRNVSGVRTPPSSWVTPAVQMSVPQTASAQSLVPPEPGRDSTGRAASREGGGFPSC